MSVLKVIEVLSSSELSWEDAAREGVVKASQTIKHIRSVYVKEQSAKVNNGGITEFRVNMKITFELE